MTLSNKQTGAGDDRPDGSEAAGAETTGTALEPSAAEPGTSPSIAAFLDAAGERVDAPRPLYSKLLDYSAHAAMIIGLLGFAWTMSDRVAKRPAAAPLAATAVVPPRPDETAELRLATQKMAADIGALRASLDALRGSAHQDASRQDRAVDQIRALSASLDGVKASLNGTRSEASAAVAQLAGKVDHLQHLETSTKLIADKLDRLEHQNIDPTPTASIAPASAAPKAAAVALPPVKPVAKAVQPEPADVARKAAAKVASVTEPIDAAKKPPVIAEWVVREVYDGVAVVESKRGPMEVVPGVMIPGAGVVKSIDRRGSGWAVTTTKGQIASVPLPRDRSARDYYRSVPDDF